MISGPDLNVLQTRSQSDGDIITNTTTTTSAHRHPAAAPRMQHDDQPKNASFRLAYDDEEVANSAAFYTRSDQLLDNEPDFRTTSHIISSPEFVRQLLLVLFSGTMSYDYMLIEALINDLPNGFFSLPVSWTCGDSPLQSPGANNCLDNVQMRRRSRFSTTMRTGLERLLSPIHKKTSNAGQRRFRPSTVSLRTEPATETALTKHDKHSLSMLQLGEMAKPTVSTAGMLQVSSERLPPKETKREDEEDEETKMGQEEEETKELVVQPVAPSSLASVAAASTTSVVSSTPVKDEATISRLKKDVKILDSEILNLKNKRSSKWPFLVVVVFVYSPVMIIDVSVSVFQHCILVWPKSDKFHAL